MSQDNGNSKQLENNASNKTVSTISTPILKMSTNRVVRIFSQDSC